MQTDSSISASSPGGIIILVFTSISFLLGISTFIYLYKKRDSFPYNNISSFWERFIIIIVILCQVIECILIMTIESILAMTINYYLFVPVVIILLIARSFSIGQCITNNSNCLSNTFNVGITKDDFETNNKKTFYKRKFIYLYHFLLIIIIYCLFFSCVIGAYLDELKLSLKSYVEDTSSVSSNDALFFLNDTDNYFFIGHLHYLLLFGILTLIIVRIIRYPLKFDKFYFFAEFFGILLIIFLSIDIRTPTLLLFFMEVEERTIPFFIFDSSFYLMIILLYGIISYLRRKQFNSQDHYLAFQDFSFFMERKYTFQLFSDYVKKNYFDQYKLLCFWADCIVYKKNAAAAKKDQNVIIQRKKTLGKKNQRKLSDDITLSSRDEILINQNEERIKAQARNLFLQYFGNNVSYNLSDSNTKSCLILIDFPADIYENAEEMFKNNYTTDNLETVFNESLTWISVELEKLFKIYITDKDEKSKMEKILFFLDCFEI